MWGTTNRDREKMLIDIRPWKGRSPKRVSVDKMMALATKLIDLTFELVDWKELSDHVHLRRLAAARGVNLPLRPLPDPPRTSSKDEERREKSRRRDS